MPTLELEFEVFCGKCGNGLCNNTREGKTRNRQYPCINVDPCEKCLTESRDDGYNTGYAEAEKRAEA